MALNTFGSSLVLKASAAHAASRKKVTLSWCIHQSRLVGLARMQVVLTDCVAWLDNLGNFLYFQYKKVIQNDYLTWGVISTCRSAQGPQRWPHATLDLLSGGGNERTPF